MTRFRSVLALSPLKISIGYFLFGSCWIPITDVLLALLFSQQIPTLLEIIKGWVFVGLSALLIFGLSHLHQQQMATTQTKLAATNQQLQVLQRVFRHNIRNDLTVIRGYIDRVSEQVPEKSLQNELAIAHQTADQLIEVSEKLKIIEEVNPTLSDEHVIDLVEIVTAEVAEIRSSYPGITVDMDMPEEALIESDTSLTYAIREALENAVIHHNQETADCKISVDIKSTSETVTLEISDNGPGIPQEELRALRTQEETPLVHMSSVGLWLVTWLCQLHSGSVEFRTEDGTAVIFRFQAEERISLSAWNLPSKPKLPL